nr:hypothetical protein [Tanacetum cinerariifolium]
PLTIVGTRLSTFAKGKQPAKASKAKSLTVLSEDDDDDQNEGNDDDQDIDEEGEEFIHPNTKSNNSSNNCSEHSSARSSKLWLIVWIDHQLKTLEANFFNIQGKRRDEAQAKNEEFLKNLDENIQKIIKEQVKEQVKVQVSNILPKIEKTVNEKLKAKVLTRSSNSSMTSYAFVADLSEMELKKILIEKMESNKSIHPSDEQRNLYKDLVKAYESDKIILDTYEDIVMLKRRCDDDADKDKEPLAGSDRGSKRQREGKEPESTSAPKEKATRTTGKSTQGSKS